MALALADAEAESEVELDVTASLDALDEPEALEEVEPSELLELPLEETENPLQELSTRAPLSARDTGRARFLKLMSLPVCTNRMRSRGT